MLANSLTKFENMITSLRLNVRTLSSIGKFNGLLKLSNEVIEAKSNNKPIVALESAIITHGMPYPHNIETCQKVEDIIRRRNATPATIALMDGKIAIGLTTEELEILAKSSNSIKVSRRDLSYALAKRRLGGSTVSTSILAANLAGIDVFVTGGIGGVHREVEKSLDISADLTELGRNRIAIVSAGVKSILDIEKTLEFLETMGVFVATYRNSTFPAFFSSSSGFKSPYSFDTPKEAAEIFHNQKLLNLRSGCLFAIPIPDENSISNGLIEEAINDSLKEIRKKNIKGKEVTPFLLSKVKDLTDGTSLEANIALIMNNARIGTEIACELKKLELSC